MWREADVCEAFLTAHPADAARVLERAAPAAGAALLARLPTDVAAPVVGEMRAAGGAECLAAMDRPAAAACLAALGSQAAVALLRNLDDGLRADLLEGLPPETREPLALLLRHRPGTAGALMDPRAVVLLDDETVGEALGRVRRAPRHLLYYLYVVDRSRTLVGVLDVQELMLAPARARVGDVMHRPVAHLFAGMERAAILAHPGWREYHALPVVDAESGWLGALRYQTFRALESEDAEDRRSHRDQGPMATAFALSELYWLGLSGLLEGMATAVTRVGRRPASQGGTGRAGRDPADPPDPADHVGHEREVDRHG